MHENGNPEDAYKNRFPTVVTSGPFPALEALQIILNGFLQFPGKRKTQRRLVQFPASVECRGDNPCNSLIFVVSILTFPEWIFVFTKTFISSSFFLLLLVLLQLRVGVTAFETASQLWFLEGLLSGVSFPKLFFSLLPSTSLPPPLLFS